LVKNNVHLQAPFLLCMYGMFAETFAYGTLPWIYFLVGFHSDREDHYRLEIYSLMDNVVRITGNDVSFNTCIIMSTTDKSIQNAVLGYQTKESRGEKLKAGTHEVSLTDWQIMHSRIKWDGSEKEVLPDFSDATPQLGIMFRDAEGNVGWHRFNMLGYKRWDDLSDKQQESGKFERVTFGEQVYACKQQANGLVRIKDEKRTAGAHSFVDQFVAAVGRTGQTVGEALPAMLESGEKFAVTLVDDDYGDDTNVKVKSFASVEAMVDDFG
jgi:hypothetical protein